MFSTPHFGWTEWEINDHKIGHISYLSDVPYEFITACCNYLRNPAGFNLVFDGEGHDSALSLIGSYFCTYSFDGDEPPYITRLHPVSEHILLDTTDGPEFIEKLLKEAILDFERDFDLWAVWNPGLYEDQEETEECRENLRNLIDRANEVLAERPYHVPELGNILFGNSRGTYPIERKSIENLFCDAFEDYFNGYGYLEDGRFRSGETDRGGYENDTFILNPYYWGDDDIAAQPNFIYKPENIEISWYKYPMRDAYSSVPLSEDKAAAIFGECVRSMKKKEG